MQVVCLNCSILIFIFPRNTFIQNSLNFLNKEIFLIFSIICLVESSSLLNTNLHHFVYHKMELKSSKKVLLISLGHFTSNIKGIKQDNTLIFNLQLSVTSTITTICSVFFLPCKSIKMRK